MKTPSLCTAALALSCSVSCAATVTKKPAQKTVNTPSLTAPLPTPELQTGVLINAVTRNDKASNVTLQLAKDGKALLPIVISAKASDATKLVAAELKKYLDQISGTNFEIKAGDGTSGIVLGSMQDFALPAFSKALEIRNTFDGKEAYAIRTRTNKLLLIGATDKGASHAAYRFLQELGCRWFFQSKAWQVIPNAPDLKFALDITERPAFLSRGFWYGWWFFSDDEHPDNKPGAPHNAQSDYTDWNRRNGMDNSLGVSVGHALFHVIEQNQAEFDKHPEYYALIGGKRQGPQIELGNPRVRAMVLDYARKFFKNSPTADMVSVDPADGGGPSESAETKAWVGDPVMAPFKMANEVAQMLQKEFPVKMVGLLAYNWHTDPPAFALEPNVYVQMTMGFLGGKLTGEQLFEEWPKKSRNLGFYDYYSVWRWDGDRWPGGRISNRHYAIDMIRTFQKANARSKAYATSISAESSNNWGPNGRGFYLSSKLMWNPQSDADAILKDFYSKAFGAGANEMQKYYEMQDDLPPMTAGVIGALFRHVDAAAKAANGDDAVLRRLDDIKNYLNYEGLNYRMSRESDADQKAKMLNTIWERAYRARYDYMNHWQAILADWIKPANGAPTPWKVDKPLTHDETESLFKENLAYFPELKTPTQINFSKELVAVNLGGAPVAFQSSRYGTYHSGVAIYLYSSGAPLRLHIEKLSGADFLGEFYYISDTKGKRIASIASQTAAQTSFDLNIPVPAPGVYELHHTRLDQQSSFKAPAQQIIAYPTALDSTVSTHGDGTPDLYFYVPKGTREINYYFQRTYNQNYGPHAVVDSNGKIVKEVDVTGDYVVVPVAPGQDGKAWHFGQPKNKAGGTLGLGQLRFFNVPNVLSASPAQMLLPKDIVAKDGLKVLK